MHYLINVTKFELKIRYGQQNFYKRKSYDDEEGLSVQVFI